MNKLLVSLSLSLAATCTFAHVALVPPFAEAGTTYHGVLHVGHGCDGSPTTSLEVQLPPGVRQLRTARSAGGDFTIELPVPKKPQVLWLKVTQHCEQGTVDWADVPKAGTSTEGMKTPAALLKVVPAQEAAAIRSQPKVEAAWVRASVPGQSATSAFMRIVASEPTKLVGVATPVAGVAQVHAMKMEGDVMRMRPAGIIDLPVGKPFELTPSGYHVMLQDLKKPLEAGSTVPITLVFRSAGGVESRLDVRAPVAMQAPGPASAHSEHKH